MATTADDLKNLNDNQLADMHGATIKGKKVDMLCQAE